MAKKTKQSGEPKLNGAVGKKEKPSEGMSEVLIPIDRRFPANHTPKPANHFVIQTHDVHEVRILFYLLRQPILLGTPEDIAETLRNTAAIDAECTAEIVLPASRLAEFAEVVSQQAEKFKKKLESKIKGGKSADKGNE